MEIFPCQLMELGITVLNDNRESHCPSVPENTEISSHRSQVCPPSNRTTYQDRNSLTKVSPKNHSCPTLHIRAPGQGFAG